MTERGSTLCSRSKRLDKGDAMVIEGVLEWFESTTRPCSGLISLRLSNQTPLIVRATGEFILLLSLSYYLGFIKSNQISQQENKVQTFELFISSATQTPWKRTITMQPCTVHPLGYQV